MQSHTSARETEQVIELAIKTIHIPQLTMFTYPTRLASAWKPDILQIEIPPYSLPQKKLKITVSPGSTESIKFRFDSKFKKVYRKFAKPVSLSGQYIFDARRDSDRNMAHLIKNELAGLVATQTGLKIEEPITVLLPARASAMAKEAYKILGYSTLCTDRHVVGTLITAPSGREGAYYGYYGQLLKHLDFEGYIQNTPDRVFIARKGTRALLNEKEIEAVLQEYGFKKFYYEDIPVSQQWSIARNAKVVVGMHGAALSTLLFNPNSPKLIELFHPGYVTHTYRHFTCCELGGRWCGVIGQMESNLIQELDVNQNARHFALSSTKIDPTSLRKALQHLEIE